MNLANRTQKLKDELDRLKRIYEKNEPPENRSDKVFFSKVKENTTPIYDSLGIWEEQALAIVKEKKINVHPHQITSTRENMELLLMHSYYVDVRRKRYMELNKSVHYIFDQLLHEIS
ncbi:protein of unknown function [Oceanobacillus limi]|uniref:DUF1798 family protein n=1 Tax=Oceanobacillus limi TaxID=930131 RepID=A0A1H9ZDY3_9BACI|nr:DUF1798 family protein [Oceanobacillus limi]SES79834.1 protein of unknown function [Oceanobacillus limi]